VKSSSRGQTGAPQTGAPGGAEGPSGVDDPGRPDSPGRRPQSADRDIRLAFMNLRAADLERMAELRPLLEKHADSLVASFYRHLLSFRATRSLLTDETVRERLLSSQRRYLLSLAGPGIGSDEYIAERLRIGEAHERVGLEPRWYFGAYALYSSLISPLIHDAYRGAPHRQAELQASLVKVLLLDAQLAMEAYITRREQQLEWLNRELAATGRSLSREVDLGKEELRETSERARAAEQLASVGTLAAGLAHEIGTPMGVIRGHAELLEGSVADERARWRLETIKTQIDRIAAIMQALLNLARPEQPRQIPVELGGILRKALGFLTEKLRRREIEVRSRFETEAPILGDPDKLQQLFLNLFLNAADAMSDGGRLGVELSAHGGSQIEVRVSDTGAGIEQEELSRIFEPFFTSKAAGQGNGLGLVVAKGIVVDHGGEIDVDSTPGSGTEFRVRFPAIESQSGGP